MFAVRYCLWVTLNIKKYFVFVLLGETNQLHINPLARTFFDVHFFVTSLVVIAENHFEYCSLFFCRSKINIYPRFQEIVRCFNCFVNEIFTVVFITCVSIETQINDCNNEYDCSDKN